jgi:outer membrane protein
MKVTMTRLRMFLVFLCVAGAASAAHAQAAPGEVNPQTIVTVSFNAAVLQTSEAQKSLTALQTRLAPKQAQLQALNNEVESLRKQVADTSNGLSDSDRATHAHSLEDKERQLQRAAEDFKSDSQNDSEQIFQQVAEKVYAFLQAYSQQHGYTAVIERGSDANPVVWWAAANMDITDELIKAYNAQSPTTSPAPASGPAHGALPKPPKSLHDSPAPH